MNKYLIYTGIFLAGVFTSVTVKSYLSKAGINL